MKSICIATDLHADADRALARAARLATVLDAQLTIVSVMPEGASAADTGQRRASLEAMVENLPGGSDLATRIEIPTGDPVASVHQVATSCDADLVVLGPHHKRGLLDGVQATTLEKLIKSTATPILLVKDPVDHDYASILVATDFSDACASATRIARKLAPEADVTLLHAVGLPYQTIVAAPGAVGDITQMVDPQPFIDDATARASAWLAAHTDLSDLSAPKPEAHPLPGLVEAAQAKGRHDLICLGAHTKRNLIDRILGSYTAELVRAPICDLLIAPGAETAAT